MGKFEIVIQEERCAGCLRCQLACSELYSGLFKPSAARILVTEGALGGRVHLTEECTGCGVCVDNCFYGALAKRPLEEGK